VIHRAGRRFLAFVVVSSLLTWWIAGQIRGTEPDGAYVVHAAFDDVAGLRAGDDVRLAGIPIGRVRAIEVVGGRAELDLAVDPDVRIAVDAVAAVRWRNLIGQRYVGIRPGSPAAPALGDGDTIGQTEDVVDLGQLVNQLAPLARAVGPEQINRILEALVGAFEGNDAAFDSLVANTGALTAALAEREGVVQQLLVDSATVTDALASRDEQIATMVSNLAAISSTIDATDQLLTRTVDEVARFSTATADVLTRASGDLGAVLELVASLTGTAVDSLGTIEEAVQTLPAMLDAVLPTINRGPFLRVNLLCISAGPGPCPHPLLFFDDEGTG
jgi:phospholipid/cholesterol/gamma-HCH transport system substrate-binding protein